MTFSGKKEILELMRSDIDIFRLVQNENQKKPIVVFVLTNQGQDKLGKFTLQHVKQQVDLSICGIAVSSPVIQEPIYGGAGQLDAPTAEQAKTWVRQINAGKCN